jgi:hypothetical protein
MLKKTPQKAPQKKKYFSVFSPWGTGNNSTLASSTQNRQKKAELEL